MDWFPEIPTEVRKALNEWRKAESARLKATMGQPPSPKALEDLTLLEEAEKKQR